MTAEFQRKMEDLHECDLKIMQSYHHYFIRRQQIEVLITSDITDALLLDLSYADDFPS